MYVCMYVLSKLKIHRYVCMYVCVCVCMYVCIYVCMYVCMYMYVCKYVCMYVCTVTHSDNSAKPYITVSIRSSCGIGSLALLKHMSHFASPSSLVLSNGFTAFKALQSRRPRVL